MRSRDQAAHAGDAALPLSEPALRRALHSHSPPCGAPRRLPGRTRGRPLFCSPFPFPATASRPVSRAVLEPCRPAPRAPRPRRGSPRCRSRNYGAHPPLADVDAVHERVPGEDRVQQTRGPGLLLPGNVLGLSRFGSHEAGARRPRGRLSVRPRTSPRPTRGGEPGSCPLYSVVHRCSDRIALLPFSRRICWAHLPSAAAIWASRDVAGHRAHVPSRHSVGADHAPG